MKILATVFVCGDKCVNFVVKCLYQTHNAGIARALNPLHDDLFINAYKLNLFASL